MSEVKMIAIESIDLDTALLCRAGLDEAHVKDLRFAIQRKKQLPPLVVYDDGEKRWLSEGHHRYAAFQAEEVKRVPVDLRQGTKRDALLNSVNSNDTHGLKRTGKDKRLSVQRLLEDEEWRERTNNWIADQCNVGDDLVADVRRMLADRDKPQVSETKQGRGGRKYKDKSTILCDRCKRTGPTKNCQACAVARREAKNGKPDREPGEDESYTKNARKQAAKSGTVLFDFRKIEEPLGKLVRAVEECAQAYGKGEHYKALDELLEKFAKEWAAAKKRLQKS